MEDAIGFIRDHPRISAKAQKSALVADGVRGILDDRTALERSARTGTTIKVRHLFLLADPKSRRKQGGWRKDLLACMGRIEKKGAVIKDVSSGLSTANPEHRYLLVEGALKALASNGRVLHLEKRRSGRRKTEFSDDVWNKVEKVWLNIRVYDTEDKAVEAIKKIDAGFEPWRARQKFGPRKYSQS